MAFALYLVRHSKAQHQHPDGDFYRELSAEGWQRLKQFLPRLKDQKFKTETYFTSPYIRARQTAQAFASFFFPEKEASEVIIIFPSLAHESTLEIVTQTLQDHALHGLSSCALFTHNPIAPSLAKYFLPNDNLYFHTPTAVSITFSSIPERGKGQLSWVEHRAE